VDEVAQFYVDCFDDDPLFKSRAHAPKMHVWYARKIVEHVSAHGRLWDRISQGGVVMGYAFWLTPGSQSFSLNSVQLLDMVLNSKKGKDIKRLVSVTEQAEALQRSMLQSKAHPSTSSTALASGNFWTLLSVFVAKQHRRHGFGRSLLLPVLEKADATHTLCFTWTTNEAALPFFFKLGFSMKEKVTVANCSIFALLRSPQKVH
jgi:ribosomal protein S18 acetylase RimI-like enzyme